MALLETFVRASLATRWVTLKLSAVMLFIRFATDVVRQEGKNEASVAFVPWMIRKVAVQPLFRDMFRVGGRIESPSNRRLSNRSESRDRGSVCDHEASDLIRGLSDCALLQ